MIEEARGNLLQADAEALVNTVNTETPHGMELLSTVHWVGRYAGAGGSPEAAIKAVHSWNERKRKMFSPSHVRVAWQQLKEGGWLQGESEPGRSRNLTGRHRRA